MKFKTLKYYTKFYFWAVVFFIDAWLPSSRKRKTQEPVPAPSTEVNLLDAEEAVLAPEPSQAEAMLNKAMLGWASIPKKQKKKIVIAVMLLVYTILFGIGNTFYWLTVIIKNHPIVGQVLLFGIFVYITYLIEKHTYEYFNNKKYLPVLFLISSRWNEAKIKSAQKLQNQIP